MVEIPFLHPLKDSKRDTQKVLRVRLPSSITPCGLSPHWRFSRRTPGQWRMQKHTLSGFILDKTQQEDPVFHKGTTTSNTASLQLASPPRAISPTGSGTNSDPGVRAAGSRAASVPLSCDSVGTGVRVFGTCRPSLMRCGKAARRALADVSQHPRRALSPGTFPSPPRPSSSNSQPAVHGDCL